jgi:hypothetical protein
MSGEPDFWAEMPIEEREALLAAVELLLRERPAPAAGFRGGLRRRLVAAGDQDPVAPSRRHQLRSISYVGLGTVCMAVAALGLVGAGPFAA